MAPKRSSTGNGSEGKATKRLKTNTPLSQDPTPTSPQGELPSLKQGRPQEAARLTSPAAHFRSPSRKKYPHRSSCDRCRKDKQKCHPLEGGGCHRCQKKDITCTNTDNESLSTIPSSPRDVPTSPLPQNRNKPEPMMAASLQSAFVADSPSLDHYQNTKLPWIGKTGESQPVRVSWSAVEAGQSSENGEKRDAVASADDSGSGSATGSSTKNGSTSIGPSSSTVVIIDPGKANGLPNEHRFEGISPKSVGESTLIRQIDVPLQPQPQKPAENGEEVDELAGHSSDEEEIAVRRASRITVSAPVTVKQEEAESVVSSGTTIPASIPPVLERRTSQQAALLTTRAVIVPRGGEGVAYIANGDVRGKKRKSPRVSDDYRSNGRRPTPHRPEMLNFRPSFGEASHAGRSLQRSAGPVVDRDMPHFPVHDRASYARRHEQNQPSIDSLAPTPISLDRRASAESVHMAMPPTPSYRQIITSSHPATPAAHAQFEMPASNYAFGLSGLITSLPIHSQQQMLFEVFFLDPLVSEGVTLLQPHYLEDLNNMMERRSQVPPASFRPGDATTLAVAFAIFAVSTRILPEETTDLLLSSQDPSTLPRSLPRVLHGRAPSSNDSTPLHRRFMDHARMAEVLAELDDPPSVMEVMLKLVNYRYARLCTNVPAINVVTGQPEPPRCRDRLVNAGAILAQGVSIGASLGLGKEWEGIPSVERELRRRVFWALFVAERSYSFATSFPYMIFDSHTTVHMVSAMSDEELYSLPPGLLGHTPPRSVDEGPTAGVHLFVTSHLWKLLTKLLDSYALKTSANTDIDLIDRYVKSLDAFEKALPSYLQVYPNTNTTPDRDHPYLPVHRASLQRTLYSIRLGVGRSLLNYYLSSSPKVGQQQLMHPRLRLVQTCKSMIRVQRNIRMLDRRASFRLFDVERTFESAMVLGLIGFVEKTYFLAKHRRCGEKEPNKAVGPVEPALTEGETDACRSGLVDGIELLEGVLSWRDAHNVTKALRILRRLNNILTAQIVANNRPGLVMSAELLTKVKTWLDSWRIVNVDMLMAEMELEDWEKILGGMV